MEIDTLFVMALVVFVVVSFSNVELFLGVVQMPRMSRIMPLSDTDTPMVSLIVPACNEAVKIEPAILSLLQQDYKNLEIIAINDRSDDDTGLILDRLQQHHANLQVLHVKNLPQGWMGKANALKLGADLARGEYLLFTDADILMEKSTISRAMAYITQEKLDHITLIFKNISPGWLLNSLILDAGAGLLQVFKPWRAKKKKSWYFMGVGAFNLVRKTVYHQIGGHESIKIHPIDDIMLGKIIKRAGFRQECLLGHDLVTIPWYDSVGQMIDGLMKNILAIINFRFLLVPLVLAAMFCFNILPLWGLLFLSGLTRLLFGLTLLVRLVAFFAGTRLLRISPWCIVGTLFSPYITFYMVLKATWLNFHDKGIYWRGTHYPLKELRKNTPLLF